MVKLIALYRKPDDVDAFEQHYFQTHVPLVKKMPGLQRVEISRITGAPMGEPPYYLMAEMYFESAESLTAAMNSPEGRAAGKDLMSFAGNLVTMMFADVQ